MRIRKNDKSREDDLRRQLEERAEKRRKMRESCKGYNKLEIIAMNSTETLDFAARLTMETWYMLKIKDKGKARNMTPDETNMYKNAIANAVFFFNKKSEENKRLVRYREECRKRELEEEEYRREQKLKQKEIVVHVK